LIPILFHLLMNLKRFQEASSTLAKFLIGMKSSNDKNGLIWYHAMCLDLLLDATMTNVSYETCCRFFVSNMANLPAMKDEASSRFYANCMLWNMRHGCVEVAEFWKRKLTNQFEICKENSITGTYTGLRLMETLTLEVAYFIKIKDDAGLLNVEKELNQVAKQVTAGVRNSNLFQERLQLHRLHLKMLKKFDEKKLQKLEKLENSALKNKDYLAMGIIKHTEYMWKSKQRVNIENFWLHHSCEGNSLTVNQLCVSDRVFPFSLPLTCKVIFEEPAESVSKF
jgi:hypothetical protein